MKTMSPNCIEVDLEELLGHISENPVLPDPEMLQFYQLRNERKIWIDMQIDASILEYERMILLWNMEDKGKPVEERKPIWIYLFNGGGSFDLEMSFIDLIDMSKTPIYTVNMGICASAAADIFLAGKKRFMTKNARLMIHQGNGGFQGDSQKVFDAVEDYKRQLEKIKSFILSHTKITPRQFKAKENNDWWMDANECLTAGATDVIISSIEEII